MMWQRTRVWHPSVTQQNPCCQARSLFVSFYPCGKLARNADCIFVHISTFGNLLHQASALVQHNHTQLAIEYKDRDCSRALSQFACGQLLLWPTLAPLVFKWILHLTYKSNNQTSTGYACQPRYIHVLIVNTKYIPGLTIQSTHMNGHLSDMRREGWFGTQMDVKLGEVEQGEKKTATHLFSAVVGSASHWPLLWIV